MVDWDFEVTKHHFDESRSVYPIGTNVDAAPIPCDVIGSKGVGDADIGNITCDILGYRTIAYIGRGIDLAVIHVNAADVV